MRGKTRMMTKSRFLDYLLGAFLLVLTALAVFFGFKSSANYSRVIDNIFNTLGDEYSEGINMMYRAWR